jgi:hypothetical protein
MALGKTVSAALLNNVTANANASTANSTTITTTDYVGLAVTLKLTFNAAATGGAILKAYGCDDDATYDSSGKPYWQEAISYVSGAQVLHFDFPSGPKYVQFAVTNLDLVQSITAIYIYATPQIA